MAQECCSVPDCTKPGTRTCSGCLPPKTRYCSQQCQRLNWTTHKVSCAGAQKYNCFLIRASEPSQEPWSAKIVKCIEPFSLRRYGNEIDEKAELQSRLGWQSVGEFGKFYDHKGADNWYYYVYGHWTTSCLKNEVASLCTGTNIIGDIAVVRSGPLGSNNYAEVFSKAELVKTAEFYRSEFPAVVFYEREKSRARRKYNWPI